MQERKRERVREKRERQEGSFLGGVGLAEGGVLSPLLSLSPRLLSSFACCVSDACACALSRARSPSRLWTFPHPPLLTHTQIQDYGEAEKYYRRALELAPFDVTSLCNYGIDTLCIYRTYF